MKYRPPLDAKTTKRFEDALRAPTFGGLRDLAQQMSAEGMSQSEIYSLFESFRRSLADVHRDTEQATLWVSVECIVGWKGRDSWWFDRQLRKDEIDEYST